MPDPHLLDAPLLRSVIDLGGDPQPELLQNLAALRQDVRVVGLDAHLLAFVGALADKTGLVPSLAICDQHYAMLQAQGDPYGFSGLTRLGDLRQGYPFLAPVAYQYALDQYRDRVIGDGLAQVLQVAATILTTGHQVPVPKGPPVLLKGPQQAATFVTESIEALTARFGSGAIEGNVMADAGAIFQRYQQRKTAPPTGVKTGFTGVDAAHGGIQPGDLALVLGFTGQLKSTVTLNIAYRAAVFYGKHVGFVPLEQSAAAALDSLAVLHCQHPKFGDHFLAVSYDRLRQGLLSAAEEDLLQTALADLQSCPDYGALLYKEPDKADVTVGDLRRWAEAKAKHVPLDLLVVDYLGLVNPSSGGLSMRESAIANLAIREAKQLAMAFNGGKGIGVLSPFQANRDGFKEAEKTAGRYSLRALAWAPEAEKSADLVYSIYRDEAMARASLAKMGNLKARDRPLLLDLWDVYANPGLRVVRDADTLAPDQNPLGGAP
jgi:hypothetical protein